MLLVIVVFAVVVVVMMMVMAARLQLMLIISRLINLNAPPKVAVAMISPSQIDCPP